MAYKPSMDFIRALDDAELRPDEINARLINDNSAPIAERLGALMDLSMSNRAKQRAMAQATPQQGTVADRVLSSFMQTMPQRTPQPTAPPMGIMSMQNQSLPGFRHGGLYHDEMGRPLPDVNDIQLRLMGLSGGQLSGLDPARDDSRRFSTAEYDRSMIRAEQVPAVPEPEPSDYQRTMDMATAVVDDPYKVGLEARQNLSGLPEDFGRALDSAKEGLLNLFNSTSQYGEDLTANRNRQMQESIDSLGEKSYIDDGFRFYNYPGVQDETDLYDARVLAGEEPRSGMSPMQRAMLLFSLAEGFGKPIQPGGSIIGNVTESATKGIRPVAADQLKRDELATLADIRKAQSDARIAAEDRLIRGKAMQYAQKVVDDIYPDDMTVGALKPEEQAERQRAFNRAYSEYMNNVYGSPSQADPLVSYATGSTTRVLR